MPYFIPFLAVGAGLWGLNRIITKDDSADQAVAKLLKNLPSEFSKWVESVKYDKDGFTLKTRADTPKEIEAELRDELNKISSKVP